MVPADDHMLHSLRLGLGPVGQTDSGARAAGTAWTARRLRGHQGDELTG
jgi:hypothetical protein